VSFDWCLGLCYYDFAFSFPLEIETSIPSCRSLLFNEKISICFLLYFRPHRVRKCESVNYEYYYFLGFWVVSFTSQQRQRSVTGLLGSRRMLIMMRSACDLLRTKYDARTCCCRRQQDTRLLAREEELEAKLSSLASASPNRKKSLKSACSLFEPRPTIDSPTHYSTHIILYENFVL